MPHSGKVTIATPPHQPLRSTPCPAGIRGDRTAVSRRELTCLKRPASHSVSKTGMKPSDGQLPNPTAFWPACLIAISAAPTLFHLPCTHPQTVPLPFHSTIELERTWWRPSTRGRAGQAHLPRRSSLMWLLKAPVELLLRCPNSERESLRATGAYVSPCVSVSGPTRPVQSGAGSSCRCKMSTASGEKWETNWWPQGISPTSVSPRRCLLCGWRRRFPRKPTPGRV